jgi:signal transduction histidine kinase/ActR/RegA family two-component response regulator
MEDWRFQKSPYLECGGLRAYAGAPLRLQDESGECVALGSLCVASSTSEETLTKAQQQTLVRLADWVVSDIVQYARARRQRERRRLTELISTVQRDMDDANSEEPILRILRIAYPDTLIALQSSKSTHTELEGRSPIQTSLLESGLWEDTDYIDDFITNSNNQELPSTRVVRVVAAPCDNVSGSSLLTVASKDFKLIFDDIDYWFVHTCAGMISQMWQKRLLAEVLKTKEKFLRGFSHQLRTPLHGIMGSVELLTEDLGSRDLGEVPISAETSQTITSLGPSLHLNTIRTASRDLNAIINSMITLNRWADTAMRDRCYLDHSIEDLEKGLADEVMKIFCGDTRYKASIIFNHDLSMYCSRLRTDICLLRDSLLPLIVNAIQSASEGVVVVSVSKPPGGKSLVVDVKDTGRGIHSDHQQRIFEPYEKVGIHSPGAGLGLTLATQFATLLHGSVELRSSIINHGSHFRATFREIEYLGSTSPVQPPVSQLKHLPSRFYNMAVGTNRRLLCNIFARYLIHIGFNDSNRVEDSFAVLDLVSDVEQHRAELSRIPSTQVAICLVPASQKPPCTKSTPDNVVYVSGPFLTSTMNRALEEADKLLWKIQYSPESILQNLETSPKLASIRQSQITTQVVMPRNVSHSPKGWPAHPQQTSVNSRLSTTSSLQDKDHSQVDPLSDTRETLPPSIPLRRPPQPTALLIDDNAINLRILEMYCTKRGLSYCCAADGLQAVEIFTRYQSSHADDERPVIQLVVMDLQMPVCDGIEATRRIRVLEKKNRWKGSAIFIVTGQDGPTDRTEAEGAGADEYFVKPVGIKLLDRSVQQYFPVPETS